VEGVADLPLFFLNKGGGEKKGEYKLACGQGTVASLYLKEEKKSEFHRLFLSNLMGGGCFCCHSFHQQPLGKGGERGREKE